jgi:hypothetical protein
MNDPLLTYAQAGRRGKTRKELVLQAAESGALKTVYLRGPGHQGRTARALILESALFDWLRAGRPVVPLVKTEGAAK